MAFAPRSKHPPLISDRMEPYDYSVIQGEETVTEPSVYGDDVHDRVALMHCHVHNKW
jgi:hypothetical protein